MMRAGTRNIFIFLFCLTKRYPFFPSKKPVKLRPFSRPAWDAAYAEKDTLLPQNFGRWWQQNGSSGTPGLFCPVLTLQGLLISGWVIVLTDRHSQQLAKIHNVIFPIDHKHTFTDILSTNTIHHEYNMSKPMLSTHVTEGDPWYSKMTAVTRQIVQW